MKNVFRILLIATSLAFPAADQACSIGEEFQVNSAWQGDQVFPAVAALTDGGYIVCWHSTDDSGFGVFCQRFDADSSREGGEFRANTTTQDDQLDPVVAGLTGGGFVVIWTSRYQDGSEYGVFGQVFCKDGKKAGDEFQVNSTIQDIQYDPAVSALSDGGFVACWQSLYQDGDDFGCYGQMFDADGQKRGSEFQINTNTAGLQGDPVPALLKNGDFVVCWTNQFASINGQLFDGNGNRKGPEFLVNSANQGPCWWIAVTPLTFGGFAVFWNDRKEGSYEVFGQRFDASANRLGNEFQVNTTLQGDQWKASAAPQPDGGFLVCWQSDGQDGSDQGIFAQLFDGDGNRKWREFQVNTTASGSQDFSVVASFPDGGFVACWEGVDQDGSGYGIFGKRYPGARFAHPLLNFRLIEPANDASVDTDSITFRWHFPGAVGESYPWEVTYNFYLDTVPDFNHPMAFRGIQDTTFTMAHPAKGRTYFWIVLARSITGDSLWSWNANMLFVSNDSSVIPEKTVSYGREFQVNSSWQGDQVFPAVAALTDGGYIVCWHGPDESGLGVFCQVFDADSNRVGREVQANTNTEYDQEDPAVAGLAGGGFVVVWISRYQDGSEFGIFGQMFDGKGEKSGDEFQLNSTTRDNQGDPAVSPLSNGGFVACWQSLNQDGDDYGCFGQIFDADGQKRGSEFQINSYTAGLQGDPVPAILKNGDFVVCWTNQYASINGQLFDASGNRKGNEFMVNPNGPGLCWWVAVTPLTNGGFAVFWNDRSEGSYEVFGRRFDGSANRLGNEFRVNTALRGDQWKASAAPQPDGGFLVCWQSDGQDGSDHGIFAQLFDGQGNRKWREFQVNATTAGSQNFSAVASFPDGGFVTCWEGTDQDGSGYGIFGKRYPDRQVAHPLSDFRLIEPANDESIETDSITFRWHYPGAARECYPWEVTFNLYLDTLPNFDHPSAIRGIQDTTFTMVRLEKGRTYFWIVLAKPITGDSLWSWKVNGFFVGYGASNGLEEKNAALPKRFCLHQNYPNPFNPETSIRFDLPSSSFVRLIIYDVQGRLVRKLLNERKNAGGYSIIWDANDEDGCTVPSGIYICRIEAKSADGRRFSQSVKMGLVR